jgi:hypothetical protein
MYSVSYKPVDQMSHVGRSVNINITNSINININYNIDIYLDININVINNIK